MLISYWKWLVQQVSAYSSPLGWIAFFLSLIPVYVAHRALRKQTMPKKKWKRVWRRCEFFLLWCIPIVGFVATKGSEWSSEAADEKVKSLEVGHRTATNEISNLRLTVSVQSNLLASANLKTLKERLIDCLNTIDKGIIPALKIEPNYLNH